MSRTTRPDPSLTQHWEWCAEEIEAGRLSTDQTEELLDILSGRDIIVEPALKLDIGSSARFDVTVGSAAPGEQ